MTVCPCVCVLCEEGVASLETQGHLSGCEPGVSHTPRDCVLLKEAQAVVKEQHGGDLCAQQGRVSPDLSCQ